MPLNNIFDETVRHQVQLQRAKAGEARNLSATVKALDHEIKAIILSLPENYSKKQLDAAIVKIEKLVKNYYATIVAKSLDEVTATVVSFETEFAEGMVGSYLAEDGVKIKKGNKKKALERTKKSSYQGKKLATWTKLLGAQKSKDVSKMVRTRAAENATPEKIAAGVNGAAKKSNNAAPKISDAHVNQAVNKSRDQVYKQNPEWVEELVWITVLDSGTTLTCGVRSNERYNAETLEPIDHANDYEEGPGLIHWGCRSDEIPTRADGMVKDPLDGEFKRWDKGERHATGADKGYKRGDNVRDNGKRYKIGTASNKLRNQSVSAKTDYETWLRTQPRAFVNDTLGVQKAAQFVDGKQPLGAFVVNNGRELTVKQLKNKLKTNWVD